MDTTKKSSHIGRKISRIRELRGMKQESLAFELGVSQQTVSSMEGKETIESSLLKQVAEILGVTPEAIENFSEEAVFNIINNTYNNNSSDSSTLIASSANYLPTFHTTEKLVELYERLLQAERDKIAYLERLLEANN